MSYTLNSYQNDVLRFRTETANEMYALLNLGSEAGEVLGVVAKAIRDGRTTEHEQKIRKELGDVLWHVAAIALDNGFTLEDIALGNYSKLKDRFDRNVIKGSGDER